MLQEKALAILKSGKNTFLTGSAGTGKTHVLKEYISYLKERKVTVAVTASTGIAATHLKGMTIHSWAGIGIKEHITKFDMVKMKAKKYLKKNLEGAQVLIIDEISMLHKNQLDMIDTVLQYFKDNEEPFGGIQVVLCGDFFQLPPIGNRAETSRDKFAFMSGAWLKAKLAICYLTEQFRQTDSILNELLNEIRECHISKKNYNLLMQTSKNLMVDDEEHTKLYTHNIDVDKMNLDYLGKLKGELHTYKAKTRGNKKLIETLKSSVLAGEELQLKVGAKVMFVKNNLEKGFVNGSMGRVVGFNEVGTPKVKMKDGKIVIPEKEDWTILDDHGRILAGYTQFPLRLAWAITVHKCQGMTLESAEIDLSKTFEKGQGYVAISRLKKLQNLRLLGLNDMALSVDELAYKADIRFKELSNEVDFNFTLKELMAVAPVFLSKCGGLIDLKAIGKLKKKRKEKLTEKESTFEITLRYLKAKQPLQQIADAQGLTKGTIAGHLIKIRKLYPNEDLSYYKPEDSLINAVRKAYYKQPDKTAISLKAIYDALNRKVPYDKIKLAIAFRQ